MTGGAVRASLLSSVLLTAFASATAVVGTEDAAVGAEARERGLEVAWAKELEEQPASGTSPVKRVVVLLEKMKAELEAEAGKESELYEKSVCWCETNQKEKGKAVADADSKTSDLQVEIEGRAASHGGLETEVARLKKQVGADQGALDTATAIREKEAAAFSEEEKSMMQAVTNLKNAIDVLSKHHGGTFVQLDSPQLASIKAVLRDVSLRYELLLGDRPAIGGSLRRATPRPAAALLAVSAGSLAAQLRGALGAPLVGSEAARAIPVEIAERALAVAARGARTEVAHGSSGALLQAAQPAPYESYSSRSSGIFGILKRMKDEFEANLSEEQKQEMKAKESFAELAAAKKAAIEAGKKKLDATEAERADNQKALTDAKEDFGLTREQRVADVEFLSSLRLNCQSLDKQWEERSSTRSEELKAVAEAIAILSEDEAKDLMRKTVSFLQQRSSSSADTAADAAAQRLRSQAAGALRRLAQAPEGPQTDDLLAAWRGRQSALPAVGAAGGPHAQLASLALSVELDSFTEVKRLMDKMVEDLKAQQQEEVASKDYCVTEFDTNEKAANAKGQEKKDLETTMDTLAATVSTLEGDIASAKAQVAETEVEVKEASETREKENAEFQAVVADQRATQTILKKALARLDAFYKGGAPTASLLQRGATRQTPPTKFTAYKKSSGASPVMGLLEQIIEDSKALESEAVGSETDAQAAYEAFVKSSNKVVGDLRKSIAAKSGSAATTKLEAEEAGSDHAAAAEELESLAEYRGDLHLKCDFLLKNFEIRQSARLQEIEAVQQAKGMLAGAAEF